jgi:hypothetical protein
MAVTMEPQHDKEPDGRLAMPPVARSVRELAQASDTVLLGRVTSTTPASMTLRVLLDIAGHVARPDAEVVVDDLPGPVHEAGAVLAFLVAGSRAGHYELTNPAGLVVGEGVRPHLPLLAHCPPSLLPLVESLLTAGIDAIVRDAMVDGDAAPPIRPASRRSGTSSGGGGQT